MKASQSKVGREVRRRRGLPGSRLAWVVGLVLLIILLQLFVFQDEGIYTLIKLKKEIREMEAHIARLEIEKIERESERDRLLNDPDYLERIARERFRMAKPGEKVFHVLIETKANTPDRSGK